MQAILSKRIKCLILTANLVVCSSLVTGAGSLLDTLSTPSLDPLGQKTAQGSQAYLQITNPDSLYVLARFLALQDGDRTVAIAICNHALNLAPDYVDIRILLGRLYAWEGRYAEAITEFQSAIEQSPAYLDARHALVTTYIWSEKYVEGLQNLDTLMLAEGPSTDAFYQQAICYRGLGDMSAARITVDKILKLDPHHEGALSLESALVSEPGGKKLFISYSLTRLANTASEWQMLVGESTMDPWQLINLEYSQKFGFGPLIGRLNLAERFGLQGEQLELESYPRFREGTYAYMGVGYSNSSIFPKWRTGIDLNQALPHAYEVSLGYRSMHLTDHNLVIFVGSVSKYMGNYLFNLKTYVTPQDEGYSNAWNLQGRRYLKDAYSYMELIVSLGIAPESGIGEEELNYLGSRGIILAGQKNLGAMNLIIGNISLSNVEINSGSFRGQTAISIGYARLF